MSPRALERPTGRDPSSPYSVLWHPDAAEERNAIPDKRELAALQHAREKLVAEGPRLGFPHSSAVRGEKAQGLRELRPRRGRSAWRVIYSRIEPRIFVILAVGPEANVDRKRFNTMIEHAGDRLRDVKKARTQLRLITNLL